MGQIVDTHAERWRFRSSSDGGKVIVIPWNRLDKARTLAGRARHFAKLFLADKISRKKTPDDRKRLPNVPPFPGLAGVGSAIIV